MNVFPSLIQMKTKQSLNQFSEIYVNASGLPIPDSYLHRASNRVFGIYWKQELVGGFILGKGATFRTIAVFAKAADHEKLYAQLGDTDACTEVCCFWIKKAIRTKTMLNLFIWVCLGYAIKRYGAQSVIYGTCSRSLARIYAAATKTVLINQDFINRKHTFIFLGHQQDCTSAFLDMLKFKLKRVFKIRTKPISAIIG